ncbi:MAG: CRTAC1 family protein [Acidobacteria bacterium]|nr:CRTAC1 family protein [Acidobacteriota bacterium]
MRSAGLATIVCLLGLALAGPLDESITLVNLAPGNGLSFRQINYATDMKYPFETLGGAAAAFDYDNDGLPDLLFLNGSPSPEHIKKDPACYNRLFRNLGGNRFADVTERSGLSGAGKQGYPQGIATGDYDNDGDVDVLITNYGDNVLYRNNGDGTFSDVTAAAGVLMNGHPFKASACWLDYDNDGFLDLFVTHYFQWTFAENGDDWCGERKPGYRTYCSPTVFKPLPNVLYRNNRDGTFTDVSELAGFSAHPGKGMGVAIADYDDDGFMDIFVTNDKMPNFLYRNEGNGTFTEVAMETGVSANERGTMVSGMGCDFKDFNNDGRPDIFYADLVAECFTLFQNQKEGFFTDVTFPSNMVGQSSGFSGWSNKFMDVDNDGWKDIFVAGSHVVDNVELYNPKYRYKDPCMVFRNLANGKLENITTRLGSDMQTLGAWRGVAVADFDRDGVLEVAVSRLNDTAFYFDRKESPANHWVVLELRGTKSNRDAIGSRLKLTLPSGLTLYEHVTTANGIYSASDKRVHFGLGKADRIASLEIRWPSGIVQTITNLEIDRHYVIEER